MTVPIGTIMAYAGKTDGTAAGQLQRQGWLICDGNQYLQSNYPELNGVIGSYYGVASNAQFFRVPDLRGRFVRGVDGTAGRDPDTHERTASGRGGNEGNNVGSVQEDEFKAHNHKFKNTTGNGNQDKKDANTTGDIQKSGDITASMMEAGGKETRPKNIYVNWIIKAKDV
ncbi:MAG: tail fiber protein [Moorea sp. SIO3I7]|uniref:phage tail protein n=1 Tax=unclassified Moorena TaxID=2683338 RepID=UPI0013BFA1F6|nr:MULTISPECIES: phage tail protein [unclassified Moorena]NEN95447.1 tail fiber protein [Moorena sp. SIO3I7]NEO07300.1 tail fiber protein [Moorena sp. SIO3I8]NEO22277.1 tail fiber protein [Moorena sp. SIO4A5]NEP25542.1 tail fiber protein [Moorena sp. SIO3I6]NEQ58791.1 tail fiber protein [Moorena sp. SIO4A1]